MEPNKVLVVEDDDAARKMLVKFVVKEGFSVVEAEDAKVAMEKIESESPGIVVTDLKMPHGDGLAIIRRAKEKNEHCQAILITAFGETDTAVLALREGVLDYIKKPIDLDMLALALGRARQKMEEYVKTNSYPTILIVEDDAESRKHLTQSLSKEPWSVLNAPDGETAITMFKEKKVDVAILDLKLPGKDGLTVLHEMRGIRQDFEAIVVTGYGDEQSVVTALREGAINFVKKPVDLEQLVLFIQKALTQLSLKRSLKFRSRELELAKNVIARIATGEGMMMIDFLSPDQEEPSKIALAVLDSIPMGLMVVNKDKDIYYVNRSIAQAMQGTHKRFDEDCMGALDKIGIRGISYSDIQVAIDRVLSAKEGAFETVNVGKWAYINIIKLLLIQNDMRTDVALLAMRGERS